MPTIKEIKIYKYDELEDRAKEKARAWWREDALSFEWWESIFEDATRIGVKLKTFDLDRSRHAKGEFINEPLEVAEAILKEHGETCETYKTAREYISDRGDLIAELKDREEVEETTQYEDLTSEFLRSILENYSIMLQHEYEYQLSDTQAEDSILANGYEFLEDGSPA